MKNRLNSKSFSFESLEKRWTMAGNVSAAVSGKSLLLTGDDLSNNISISGTGVPGQVLITGNAGTTINGSAAPLLLKNITSTIQAKLKAGDDLIDVRNIVIGQDLIIEGNQGRDTVFVGNARIGDDLLIYTHENNDSITVCNIEVPTPENPEEQPSLTAQSSFVFEGIGTGVYVGDQFEIDAGAGNNEIEVCYTQINGNTFLTTGGNNDDLYVYNVSFGKNVNVITNGGSDTLNFGYYIVKNELKVDTASGNDRLMFYNAIHYGAVNIFTGANNDTVYIGGNVPAFNASLEVPNEQIVNVQNEKNFFLDTNSGSDSVETYGLLTKGNLTIQLGSENDELNHDRSTNYKDVVIDLGSGNDYYRGRLSLTGGNFLLIGGSGIDEVISDGEAVNKKFTVDLGSENDYLAIGGGSFTDLSVLAGGGIDVVYVLDTRVVKKASFDGGSGKDRLDRSGLNSFGSLSIVGFETFTAVGPF